jgi:DNA helicase-2/ATP-dependent DNA helicase PcrA
MPRITKTFGPPGTGKTTRLIERVREEVSNETALPHIAYLSFSVAAKEVIRERLGASEQDVRWFRTIHGAACKHLGISQGVMNWTHYKQFKEQTGMKLSPDDYEDEFDRKDIDFNIALRAHNLASTMMIHPREVIRTLPDHPNLQWSRFEHFVETYTKFKRDNHLFDFMDMLTEYHRIGEPLPVDVGILDEGQDLSPLQWACFEKMVAGAERIYMAGDDDQSIYTFIGASEYGFLEHACDEEEVLTRSYRVPEAIGVQADRIIRRVAHRKEKAVQWKQEPGFVSRINQDAMGINWKHLQSKFETIMVLARHRKGAERFSDDLKLAGVAHSLNGETMNTWPEAKILHSLYALKDGRSITSAAALKLAEALGRDTRKFREMGRRDRVSEIEGVNVRTLDWLEQFSTSRRARLRYQSLLRLVKQSGYAALDQEPAITVSTMHASKGKEADLVVIVPDCTNIVKKNGDTPTEIRLSYVTLTRAKREAMLVLPRTDTYINHFFQ